MNKNIWIILLLLIFIVGFSDLVRAQISRSEITGSYIYNFGNKISRPNNDLIEFNIVLISTNQDIIRELNNMAENEKINDKDIVLTILNEPEETAILNAQIVFLTQEKSIHYMTVFDIVEGKEILLVSENFGDKSYVMLNLYDTEDKKLLFEINRPNIINQGLTIGDEVLLLSGSEIDIAEVYLKSQHSLRAIELELNSYTQSLDSLNKEILNSNKRAREQEVLIGMHKQEIASQDIVLKQQVAEIDEYKALTAIQLSNLKKYEDQLVNLKDTLSENEKFLLNQKQEIEKSNDVLEQQTARIETINEEIERKNIVLSDQEEFIDLQSRRMMLLVTVTVVIVIFLALIIYAYRQNRKKSWQLYQQRQEIRKINKELNLNNEELKSTLKELKDTQRQLVESEKMASLGVLSAGIAHEINNPINFVYAGINSLMRDFKDIEPIIAEVGKLNPDSDDLREKLNQIKVLKEEHYFDTAAEAIPEIINDIKIGADRTAEIVKGLQSFSRTDTGEQQHMDVHEGIETTLVLLKNKYKNHIEIIKSYGDDIHSLKCYPGKINQVFMNIFSNAMDAIKEDGKIRIKTGMEDGKIMISIKDSGDGMSREVQEKIFDPFFTTKAVGEGIGLGLAISYGIVKEHGGNIEVVSEPGEGSEFIINLPVKLA